jgi:glycosyltransferase involved in cell wall biosynthesis
MKIVYVIPNIIPSFNASGGASVIATRLLSFIKLNLEIQLVNVYVVTEVSNFDNQNLNVFFNEFHFLTDEETSVLKSICANMIDYPLHHIPRKKGKIASLLFSLKDPVRYSYSTVNSLTASHFQSIVKECSPQLIIAEHLIPALLAQSSQSKIPVIYCHHDWIYMLLFNKIRQASFSLERFYNILILQFVEKQLVKRVNGVIFVSAYESNKIQKQVTAPVLYLPTLYPKSETNISERAKNEIVQLVHFGGMAATANRLGLENFIDKCWDEIKSENPEIELEVIGSLNHISERLKIKLKCNRINCHGFVGELSDVLLPFAINIIPWDKPTGGRTRIPLVFKHRQVLLSTYNAVKGSPEVQHLKNSYLVNKIEDFPKAIQLLKNDRKLMKELSNNGYSTFENYFTINGEQSCLKSFLESVVKKQ